MHDFFLPGTPSSNKIAIRSNQIRHRMYWVNEGFFEQRAYFLKYWWSRHRIFISTKSQTGGFPVIITIQWSHYFNQARYRTSIRYHSYWSISHAVISVCMLSTSYQCDEQVLKKSVTKMLLIVTKYFMNARSVTGRDEFQDLTKLVIPFNEHLWSLI